MQNSFGEHGHLTALRHAKGISLQEISEATKIRVHYLEGIEEGRFERLPGGIYSRSYIRQYARAIGYDEGELLDHYHRCMGIESEVPAGPEPASFRKSVSELLRLASPLRF